MSCGLDLALVVMLDKLLNLLTGVPDHILALMIVALGSAMAFSITSHDTSSARIAAGLAMWQCKGFDSGSIFALPSAASSSPLPHRPSAQL